MLCGNVVALKLGAVGGKETLISYLVQTPAVYIYNNR